MKLVALVILCHTNNVHTHMQDMHGRNNGERVDQFTGMVSGNARQSAPGATVSEFLACGENTRPQVLHTDAKISPVSV